MHATLIKRVGATLGSALFGLGALATAASPARADMEHASLALPATALVFLSAYVAEDAKIWEKQGLDVKVLFIAGVGAFNAVVSGSSEFSMSSGLTMNRAAAHGQRMLAIANTLDHLPMDIVLRKDLADAVHFDPNAPLAVRAQALKGRTMGVDTVNSVVHAYLRVIAKIGGLDPDSIQIAPAQPADMLAAFDRKSIDGFSNGPPWPQMVVEGAGTAVRIASGGNGEPADIVPLAFNVVATRPQYCAEHASICTKMAHAMADAAVFIQDHPDETFAFVKKRFAQVGDAALKAAFDEVRRDTPRVPTVSEAGFKNADRLNIEAGLMKPDDQVPSYDGLFTDKYLK